jgi:hypothetical protein
LSRGDKLGTSTSRRNAYIEVVLPEYPYILHFGMYHEDNRSNENYIDPYGQRVFVDSLEPEDDLPVIE